MTDHIIPGAVTVAVGSGKGGVGKTTTAVSLATALAARGLDVIVLDADLDGPNVHLVAEIDDLTLGIDRDALTLQLPRSPFGFRTVTSESIPRDSRSGRVSVTDLIGMARFAAPSQVVIVDLPPGWTSHHEQVCSVLPELVATVVAPTGPALADHERHVAAWTKNWASAVMQRKSRDRRRKLDLPDIPNLVAVETMARFAGIPDNGGDPVTVRRLDAVPVDEVTARVSPLVSIPAAASIGSSADSPEIGTLADLVNDLVHAAGTSTETSTETSAPAPATR